MNIYEVTLKGQYKPRIVTLKALDESSVRNQFDNKEIIAITSLKKIELGKVSLLKSGVIA